MEMRCAERVEQGVQVNVIWYSGWGGLIGAGLSDEEGVEEWRSVRGLERMRGVVENGEDESR